MRGSLGGDRGRGARRWLETRYKAPGRGPGSGGGRKRTLLSSENESRPGDKSARGFLCCRSLARSLPPVASLNKPLPEREPAVFIDRLLSHAPHKGPDQWARRSPSHPPALAAPLCTCFCLFRQHKEPFYSNTLGHMAPR